MALIIVASAKFEEMHFPIISDWITLRQGYTDAEGLAGG